MTPEEKRRMADVADACASQYAMFVELARRDGSDEEDEGANRREAYKYRCFALTLRREADEMEAKQEQPEAETGAAALKRWATEEASGA